MRSLVSMMVVMAYFGAGLGTAGTLISRLEKPSTFGFLFVFATWPVWLSAHAASSVIPERSMGTTPSEHSER